MYKPLFFISSFTTPSNDFFGLRFILCFMLIKCQNYVFYVSLYFHNDFELFLGYCVFDGYSNQFSYDVCWTKWCGDF